MEIDICNKQNSKLCPKKYLDFIPVIDASTDFNNFYCKYLIQNQACIIKNIGNDWESTKLWVNNNMPNFDYLEHKYGSSPVMVYDCNEKFYNSHKTLEQTFVEYLAYWKLVLYGDQNGQQPLLYLKDWHLKNNNATDMFYEVPHIFASDWLNEYFCENKADDYRFVYMGPKGTWTPFHADVFTSFSWSVNICGQKRWLLLPPGEELKLKNDKKNLPYEIEGLLSNITHFEVYQNPGEAIFVPSGWHHQVWNTKDTISINHNWINSCNIKTMYFSTLENLRLVKEEIKDCEDMENFHDHCQVLLKASYGLSIPEFIDFLKYIALKRIKNLEEHATTPIYNGYIIGKNLSICDLCAILEVLVLLLDDNIFDKDSEINVILTQLIIKIKYVVEKHKMKL